MPRRGRPENLKRGREKGSPATRTLSEQKITDFCLYYLTHGESLKTAALHTYIAFTYMYEFFKKPAVQAKLEELRLALGEKMLQEAANQRICNGQFIDERLASIMSEPSHPKRGYTDQIAAARLAADINGLIDRGKQSPVVAAQIIQTISSSSDDYMPEIDRRRQGIDDPRSEEIEQRLSCSSDPEEPSVGAKNKGSTGRPQ